MPKFKWLTSIQTDPSQRNQSLRCDYHRDHGHETDKCRSLKFMVEKLIKEGHLRKYIREIDYGVESGQVADRVTIAATILSESRPTINYILGGPSDKQYQSKRQQKKLLRVATVKAWINVVHLEGKHKETKPIDDPISFPLVNSNKVVVPHYDAPVLILCINGFDVNMVLIDPGSVADLLQLLAFEKMKLSLGMLNLAGWILYDFNGATTITLGDVTLPVKAGPATQQFPFSIIEDLGPYKDIMGRAGLHSMKAIPSTYHQMVSYLTDVGQVDLLSNQLVTR